MHGWWINTLQRNRVFPVWERKTYVVVIIIIIIIIITFTQGICNYILKTNNVSRVYSVAATLLLLFMVHVMLFTMLNVLHFYISTVQSIGAVPNVAVFCSSLISCFPVMLRRYFQNDYEMVPVAFVITGITFVSFHMRCISTARCSYFL
jgi:hypothetical protein